LEENARDICFGSPLISHIFIFFYEFHDLARRNRRTNGLDEMGCPSPGQNSSTLYLDAALIGCEYTLFDTQTHIHTHPQRETESETRGRVAESKGQ
jgi:hypothetical protein